MHQLEALLVPGTANDYTGLGDALLPASASGRREGHAGRARNHSLQAKLHPTAGAPCGRQVQVGERGRGADPRGRCDVPHAAVPVHAARARDAAARALAPLRALPLAPLARALAHPPGARAAHATLAALGTAAQESESQLTAYLSGG